MKKLIFAASFALAIFATACSSKSNSDQQLGEGVDSTVVEETVVTDTVCPGEETCTDVPCDTIPCEAVAE